MDYFKLHVERQALNAIIIGVMGTHRYFCLLIQDIFFKKMGLSDNCFIPPIYIREIVEREEHLLFIQFP